MSGLEQALGRPAIEVVAKAERRQFTGEYKRKIVREADDCKTPGAIGALLVTEKEGQARRLTMASVAALRSRSSNRRDHDGVI